MTMSFQMTHRAATAGAIGAALPFPMAGRKQFGFAAWSQHSCYFSDSNNRAVPGGDIRRPLARFRGK